MISSYYNESLLFTSRLINYTNTNLIYVPKLVVCLAELKIKRLVYHVPNPPLARASWLVPVKGNVKSCKPQAYHELYQSLYPYIPGHNARDD